MCGVVGILSRSGRVSCDSLTSAMHALRHRGPDGEGKWMSDDSRVGLAHTRLSIIDLDTGAQPIENEDGTIRIVMNGEFYGFEEIRRNLEGKGHRFRTKSDSEIALHLYEEYGTACLTSLRGEFAFIIWDDRQNRIFAARDRFGIKPLYYAENSDGVYLASEAKALIAAGVRTRWDKDVAFQLLFACVSQDRTLFHGVNQIPPGHFLLAYHGSDVELHRYWDADYPLEQQSGDRQRDPRDWIDGVRALLQESVRLRLRADVPVGCLLSGGLDSAVALGIATSQGANAMHAFTITFEHPDYDESAWAKESADFNRAPLTFVSASDENLGNHFVQSVEQGEVMQFNAHGTARYLLSRAVRDAGYKTVLAGEGSDEMFAGYGFCRSAVLSASNGNHQSSGLTRSRLRTALRLMRPSSADQKAIATTSRWLSRASKVIDLPDWLTKSLAERMGVIRGVMSPDLLHRKRNLDPYKNLFDSLQASQKLKGREPAKQLIYLWLKTIFPGYILAADRADMAHGVEVRLPFLDHVLFDHVRDIPVRALAPDGENKYMLREAAAQYISPGTRTRPKKPLMAPPFTPTKRSRLNTVIQDVVRSNAMRDVPFFAPSAIADLADKSHNGNQRSGSADPLLIMAASICVLQEKYKL
ncbi:MAG TPA: asparagine synthase (glutamine-hydrolyzing) [Gemmatimonadaceae bacterium]|nr:asparagine synthase (glutamine-hydrolyzing) [Gemmatimonadaceae bacterium]